MATIELKNDTWEAFTDTEFCIIDCYGDQCAACVILEPVYDGVADELGEIAFGRINITYEYDIADRYQVMAMPTLLYFRNGELIHQSVGSIGREELLANISVMLYQ